MLQTIVKKAAGEPLPQIQVEALARILHDRAVMQYPPRPKRLREPVRRGRASHWPENKLLSGQ